MHNLFLGTSKLTLSLWKQKEYMYITHSDFEIYVVQEKVDAINSPANIGHIPGKISSGFSGFIAEQLMVWTVIYLPVILIITLRALQTLVHFSCACSYLCKPYISRHEVDKADELLVKFCAEFEQLYGKEAVTCTSNLHMHMHLKGCILDTRPVYMFYLSFER